VLFQSAESYDVASMKHEMQDANVVRARHSRRRPCSAAASNKANSGAAGNICLMIIRLL